MLQYKLQYYNINCGIATFIVISQIKKHLLTSVGYGLYRGRLGKIDNFGEHGEESMTLGYRTKKIPSYNAWLTFRNQGTWARLEKLHEIHFLKLWFLESTFRSYMVYVVTHRNYMKPTF